MELKAYHRYSRLVRGAMSRDLNDNITQTFRDLKVTRLGDHDAPVRVWNEADIDALEAEMLQLVREIVGPQSEQLPPPPEVIHIS